MASLPLTSTLGGGELLTSCPGIFTLRKEPWDPLIRRLDGLQSQSVCFGEIFFAPVRNQILDCTAHSLITIYIPIPAPSPYITLFIIFIVVFDLSSSFLAVMADPVSLTTSPVHSEVLDWYRSNLCRSCGVASVLE